MIEINNNDIINAVKDIYQIDINEDIADTILSFIDIDNIEEGIKNEKSIIKQEEIIFNLIKKEIEYSFLTESIINDLIYFNSKNLQKIIGSNHHHFYELHSCDVIEFKDGHTKQKAIIVNNETFTKYNVIFNFSHHDKDNNIKDMKFNITIN